MTAQPLADPVELLLPDASKADLDLAERLTRALCIFSSDAADSGSPSVHVQLESARDELGLYHAGTVGSLLQDLLIHVALESMSGETYLMLPVPRRTYAAAWSQAFATTSEEERRELGLGVPAAAKPPLAVLGELVNALEKHATQSREAGAGRTRELAAQLWRIRFERLAELARGPESRTGAALESLLGQLARVRGSRARALRVAVLSDLVALQLDLGQVVAASEAVRRAGPTALQPVDCQSPMDLLALMVRWLVGDGDLPDLRAAMERCTARGTAPPGWSQLVAHCRGASSPQAGGPSEVATAWGANATASGADTVPRKALGVTALVVSAIQPNGTLKVLHSDVAPGLTSECASWSTMHRVALAERGTPEHDVGCRAAPLLLVRATEAPGDAARIAASCIARRRSRKPGTRARSAEDLLGEPSALVVQPILDGDGEPAGLLWLECPTRLVPSLRTRETVARAMGQQFLFGDGAAGSDVFSPRTPIVLESGAPVPAEAGGAPARARSASSDLRNAWESVVASLQLKTAERRWIAFHVGAEDGQLQMVATGGAAGDRLGRATDEGTWAIRRSLRTGGAVRYGHGGAGVTMLHPGAISGAALPLHRGGRVIAVLSLESARRGDAREVDVDRWFETLQVAGPAVEAAILSAADRRLFDGGIGFAPDEPDFDGTFQELCTLGRSPADVLVTGEVGTGRRTWTRLVHHAASTGGGSPTADGHVLGRGTLVVRTAFSLGAEEILELGRDEGVATLALSDLEWLSTSAQAALLEVCSKPMGQRPRVLATLRSTASDPTTRRASGEAAGEGHGVHPQLLRLLGRVVVRRTALRHRRHRIPSAARFLLGRIGQRELQGEGVVSPVLEDAAMAHLWRQPWVENLSGLEAVLYSLFMRVGRASSGYGEAAVDEPVAVSVEEVQAALLDTGLESVPRLPSRSPSALDLAAALWTTRTATGRINKTRAALYLGWDPNTLSLRLKEGEVQTLDQARALLSPAP